MGIKNFLKRLIDNKDASANSKIIYSFVGVILLVAMVTAHLFGVVIGVDIVYAIIAFILGLLGINAIPTKN
jgi:uncharacterized membrane protein